MLFLEPWNLKTAIFYHYVLPAVRVRFFYFILTSNRKILYKTLIGKTDLNFNRWMFGICEIITFKVTTNVFLGIARETKCQWCKGRIDDDYLKHFGHIFFHVGLWVLHAHAKTWKQIPLLEPSLKMFSNLGSKISH